MILRGRLALKVRTHERLGQRMGTVFKKTFTKPLPAGAELFIREGKQFARWKDTKAKTRKALVTASKEGQARILIEAKTYTAKYRDGGRIVREVSTGCRDEQAARSVLAELERRAELVKAGVMTTSEDEIAEVDPKNWTIAEGVILSEESPME
jgi:hypothetical protein